MCDFPSWKESGTEIAYLTDEEAKEHFLRAIDAVGHSAIEKVFPKTRRWKNKEMVQGDCVPKEFVKAIHGGKCRWMMTANKYKKLHFNSEGQLHSINDEPAVEYVDGDKEWYKNGQPHREDNPAVEYSNGDKYWYVNGHLHREDGPAIEYVNGDKYWYRNGKFIRDSS